MFGRKLKTQKENVISAQEETLDMHPVIHVADSIIEYQKQLAEREVESLDEMADIQKAFVLATKENERLKDQVQELSSVFADVGQIATSFDGVKNEIVDSVGEAQKKVDELKNSSKEVSRSFDEIKSAFAGVQVSVQQIKDVGHYVGSLKRRVELQNSGEYDKIFIMIADAQALTDNADNPEKVRQNIIEVALDYLSVGLDPAKSDIFIQSQISQLTELTFYYMNLVTVSRLQRNPTVKSEIQMRNFEASIPVGFFCYPISQAADITAFKATTVPAGEDQEPMIEQTREIVRKFNSVYGDTLVEPQILLPDNKVCLRLPGTDGKAKMSKSLGNCIYLSDTEEDVKKKVMSMYTDPDHIKVSDPGKIEGNTVFTYLDAFSKEEDFGLFLPEYNNLDELKDHYKRGGLGDVKVKKFLLNVLNKELEPIRNRRHEYEKDIPYVYEILKQGTKNAYEVAEQTLSEVKAAMKINYFDDVQLIKAQSEKYTWNITLAPFIPSSLITLATDFSLPGIGVDENTTQSPGWIDTFL